MTKLCVTRHGETDWNVAQILQGWIDVPLNDVGRQQSRELADQLHGYGFSRICTSPLRRSAETAEIIAEVWGLPPPDVHEGLKERNFGHVQGMPKSELVHVHPGLYEEIQRRNPAAHFDDGETLDHFADRILEALDEIASEHSTDRILVITHGWVMDVITRHIKGVPRDTVLNLKRKNGESIWLEVTPHATLCECEAPEQENSNAHP